MTDVLSDLLQHSLRVVLCGTAAGTTSAAERAYYAHRQNKFWKILHETKLTPELLRPQQYRDLLQHGIGLTDLVKAGAGMDRATLPKLTAADRARLRKAIMTFRPRFLAFTSKTAGQKFLDGKRDYGEQPEPIGDTRVWIAVDFGRGQWKLAAGDMASVCGRGTGGGVSERMPAAFPFSPCGRRCRSEAKADGGYVSASRICG